MEKNKEIELLQNLWDIWVNQLTLEREKLDENFHFTPSQESYSYAHVLKKHIKAFQPLLEYINEHFQNTPETLFFDIIYDLPKGTLYDLERGCISLKVLYIVRSLIERNNYSCKARLTSSGEAYLEINLNLD